MSFLISVEDLADRLGQPNLRIVDASWHLDGRDARADFQQAHIPGAVFFDLDAVSDRDSPLPHMMPTPTAFAEAVGALGVAADDLIVIYDTAGLFSAARVWWMFRTMGARDVRVLDGGLPVWRSRGFALEQGDAAAQPAAFDAIEAPSAVAGLNDVRDALKGDAQVIDARSAGRFAGKAAEPRPGVRSGHMPGALNLPFGQLLDSDGKMKPGDALAQAFVDAGVDLARPAITTCGSGVTAAVLTLG
ncbi:MAG TPA: 3-mercaptopyruvate sulfurtransferase, partial [Brevundimonas sp.]|nr:3-mercaptopyruvate sulfurtransferase [Brevundimonas sp.]